MELWEVTELRGELADKLRFGPTPGLDYLAAVDLKYISISREAVSVLSIYLYPSGVPTHLASPTTDEIRADLPEPGGPLSSLTSASCADSGSFGDVDLRHGHEGVRHVLDPQPKLLRCFLPFPFYARPRHRVRIIARTVSPPRHDAKSRV